MSRALRVACLLFTLSLASGARAQVSATATARQLAIQGIDFVESGNCAEGEPLLERAEKLHHASVHLQYLARCRSRAGRLVAATEMWRQVVREGAPPGASPAVVAAVNEANAELERTLPRLASATIRTQGRYEGLELKLDGATLPVELIGAAQVVDPGEHELQARAPGFAPWSKRFTVTDGQAVDVDFTLEPGASGESPAETPGAEPTRPGDRHERHGSGLTTAGWIVGSTGAATMVGGVVTWLMRNNKRSKLEDDCPGQTCPVPPYTPGRLEDEKQSIRTLTTVTNVLMFGGGALLAGGVTLIVLGEGSKGSTGSTRITGVATAREGGLYLTGKW